MARSGRYRVPFRRRREGRTNYYKRKMMITSGKMRLVVRRTLRQIITHVCEANKIGDYTVVYASSFELRKYGWKGSFSNTPAAYLTGYLIAKKASSKGLSEVVPDIGLNTPSKGCRVFAALKGAVDGGLKLRISEKVIPSEDRIKGLHIAKYAEELEESDPEAYKRQFSSYIREGVNPKEIPGMLEDVKRKIDEAFGG
ncbi:MAG: 50S ribosomal protein L18 [Candidatus Asgardarchaeia archaeon]